MNGIDQLVSQYKQGWKTTEFWVAIAAAVGQAVAAGFDTSPALNKQLTNLTWIAMAYIFGRSGLKVARNMAQARMSTGAQTETVAPQAIANGSAELPAADGDGPNERMGRLRALVALRDSGALTPDEFERAASGLE